MATCRKIRYQTVSIFVSLVVVLFVFLTDGLGQNKGFGIGVIAGEPTGISAKKWTSVRTAFDLAAAWSLRNNDSFTIHADYLGHKFNILPKDLPGLAFYYGLGGRIRLAEVGDDELGVRIPLGLNYHLRDIPLGLFLELVPVLDLTPATDLEVNAAIGVRYFFE